MVLPFLPVTVFCGVPLPAPSHPGISPKPHVHVQTDHAAMRMDLETLVPLPALQPAFGTGIGLAVCPTLGLLVTSVRFDNSLRMFTLPRAPCIAQAGSGSNGLARVCTLGGAVSPAPMLFGFEL